jgi:transcription initiation factor IIE alpha subunit
MSLDARLIKHTLNVLKLHDSHPASEPTLASDVELESARACTVDEVRTALQWLRDQGLADSRTNLLKQTVWTVTEKGRSAEL